MLCEKHMLGGLLPCRHALVRSAEEVLVGNNCSACQFIIEIRAYIRVCKSAQCTTSVRWLVGERCMLPQQRPSSSRGILPSQNNPVITEGPSVQHL